jgi:hypothetical protein
MRNLYNAGRAVVLGSLLVLGLVVGVSAPAWAVDVSACGDFSASTATRFDLVTNITFSLGTGDCLLFPANAVVYMHGFAIVGPGINTVTSGIVLDNDSFLWGPGILRGFGTCVSAGNDVAVEGIVTNWCGTGIVAGDSYKIKEVRVHDCLPSSLAGTGIRLGQGGFIESSIVRNCDNGVVTLENNKIWNLVVTGHIFVGLRVATGNAVSRTVISHPGSSQTVGLLYSCGDILTGGGCQDGSNSVNGHAVGNNIQVGGVVATTPVVTQPQENLTHGATNCNGAPVLRLPLTGRIFGNC